MEKGNWQLIFEHTYWDHPLNFPKSVANCLNDILKDNPEVGKRVLELWSKDAGKERKWIIKHALRGLIKKKDTWALDLAQR